MYEVRCCLLPLTAVAHWLSRRLLERQGCRIRLIQERAGDAFHFAAERGDLLLGCMALCLGVLQLAFQESLVSLRLQLMLLPLGLFFQPTGLGSGEFGRAAFQGVVAL